MGLAILALSQNRRDRIWTAGTRPDHIECGLIGVYHESEYMPDFRMPDFTQFWLPLVGLLFTAYQTYIAREQYKMTKQAKVTKGGSANAVKQWWKLPQVIVMVCLAVLCWGPTLMKVAGDPSINEDVSDQRAVKSWGATERPEFSIVVANGKYLLGFRTKFKPAGYEVLVSGTQDVKDDPISKSALHDIVEQDIRMRIHRPEPRLNGANLGLRLVPIGLDISSASTVRQAQALGCKRIWMGSSGGGG